MERRDFHRLVAAGTLAAMDHLHGDTHCETIGYLVWVFGVTGDRRLYGQAWHQVPPTNLHGGRLSSRIIRNAGGGLGSGD